MNKRNSLDEMLASLPREVPPERDLWQGIRAEIGQAEIVPAEVAPPQDKTPAATDATPLIREISSAQRFAARARHPSVAHITSARWFQLAAGLLLMLATSVTTFVITRQSMEKDAAVQLAQQQQMPAPQLNAMPVSFGPEVLGAEYMKARADLDARFAERIKTLPPTARVKVERNLADLRRAANEIASTLNEHPSDPLLQDLLMSTYQRELQLLADVNDVAATNAARTDL